MMERLQEKEKPKGRLMSVHVIHFSGVISTTTTERMRDSCLQALSQGATMLRLHFASVGGLTPDSFSLYGFLRSLPVPLVMHNIGNVDSVGVIVFLAGQCRYACNHSRFLIHPLSWSFSGTIDHARLRETVAGLNNDVNRYAQIFDERTKGAKKPLKIRRHLSRQEKIVTAAAAIDCGLVSRIEEAIIPQGAAQWWVSAV